MAAPIDIARLADASPSMQKQLIGECLLPLVLASPFSHIQKPLSGPPFRDNFTGHDVTRILHLNGGLHSDPRGQGASPFTLVYQRHRVKKLNLQNLGKCSRLRV